MDEKYIYCVAQKAIIRLDDKFLILKRNKNKKIYPEHWDFPGGKLEHGENFDQSLVREVKEETSMDIFVEESEFIYVEEDVGYAYVVLFNCEKAVGDIKLSDEHSEFKWITKNDAMKLKLEPYLKAFFESID